MQIAIIGAGASGMLAAITAASDPNNEIFLFERQSRVGRKLLATGNGRCNLSNVHAGIEHYHGQNPTFAGPALEWFSPEAALRFFRSLGLLTVSEPSGRVYPFSNQANSVVDVLRFALQKENTHLLCGCEITAADTLGGRFRLESAERTYNADRLIVAAGGVAGSKLGGTMSGYHLLQRFGHHCTKLYPSLVQLKTDSPYPRSLKGVRADGHIVLLRDGAAVASAAGEIQFTEFGISGPAVFELSRAASPVRGSVCAVLDLLPQCELQTLVRLLQDRCMQYPQMKAEDLLTGMVHNRLGRTLLRSAGFSLETTLSALTAAQLHRIAEAVKQFSLPIQAAMGMDCAQVTAGGIVTEEFDPQTLESRLVPGLYATGEVLDIDGDCGGYNLQWAWASGALAGQLRSAKKEK